MDERDFARFELKMSCWRISYIVTPPPVDAKNVFLIYDDITSSFFIASHWSWTLFTVPLQSQNGKHLHAVRAMWGDYQWPYKRRKIPTGITWAHTALCLSHNSLQVKSHDIYFDQLTISRQYQPIWSYVSNPFDSAVTARSGLCNSLPVLDRHTALLKKHLSHFESSLKKLESKKMHHIVKFEVPLCPFFAL